MNIFQFYHDFYLAFNLVKISFKHGIRLHFSFSFETWITELHVKQWILQDLSLLSLNNLSQCIVGEELFSRPLISVD